MLVTPYNRITYDGVTVEIEATKLIKTGDHSGLCGSLDGDKRGDLKTAQQVVVTVTEQVKKIGEELAAYATQQQKLRDDFSKAVAEQKTSIELFGSIGGETSGQGGKKE